MTTNNSLQKRARFYAHVLSILFQQQQMSGGKLAQANRAARHLSLGLRLFDATELDKALKLSEPLALASNSQNVLAQRQAGLVMYQFQLAQGFWQSYTRQDLPTHKAVGLAERRQPIEFDFTYPHALVAGSTGSGKSETIKSILVSLMQEYTPGILGIVLCDLHDDYSDFANETHLLTPIATSQDEIEKALLYVNQELIERKENNIKDGKIIVLVMDEADKILLDDKRLAIVESITQEGRKYRIHVIVGTQKPSHKDLPKILDNLLNRFVGFVSDAKVSANITGRAGLEAHKLTGSGDFIHIAGLDIKRFQVAMATSQDFNSLERGEVKPVTVEPDLIILPEPEIRQAGRPKLEVLPEYAAWYHFFNNEVSISQAKDFGISRDNHNLHKDFVAKFMQTTQALLRGENIQ